MKYFLNNGSGAIAIDYGLIAALVSVAAIGALTGACSSRTDHDYSLNWAFAAQPPPQLYVRLWL